MTPIETLKARLPNGNKAKAELIYDQHAANPRDCDNLGTILIAPNKSHWIASASSDSAVDTSIHFGKNPFEHWENLRREQLKLKKSDIAIAYPVTKYEHGEISLQLGYESGWDYTVSGFVYVTKETLRKEYGVTRITKSVIARAESCLQDELDTLTRWLNGHCYGWQIKEYAITDDGLDCEEVDTLDACWGYFDKEQALCDMKDMLSHCISHTL